MNLAFRGLSDEEEGAGDGGVDEPEEDELGGDKSPLDEEEGEGGAIE